MPFDSLTARAISDAFREFVSDDLTDEQRTNFERLLQAVLGIKNLRNVQLWTRRGAIQRDFINSRLTEFELDLRTWIARKLLSPIPPAFPVKTRRIPLPFGDKAAQTFVKYATQNYIREYSTRLYFGVNSLIIEYAADSNVENEEIDLDSDEFSDILEDETGD